MFVSHVRFLKTTSENDKRAYDFPVIVIFRFEIFFRYCVYSKLGEERGVYRALLGKTEGRRPLGRPRRRWVDNIRVDLQEVRCGHMDWMRLAQDRDRWRTLVSAVMNLRVP